VRFVLGGEGGFVLLLSVRPGPVLRSATAV